MAYSALSIWRSVGDKEGGVVDAIALKLDASAILARVPVPGHPLLCNLVLDAAFSNSLGETFPKSPIALLADVDGIKGTSWAGTTPIYWASSSATPAPGSANFSSAYLIAHLSHATPTMALPAVADVATGAILDVVHSGTGNATLDPAASELIDGASTFTLCSGQTGRFQNSGTAWVKVAVFATAGAAGAATTSSGATITLTAANFASGRHVVHASHATPTINLPPIANVVNGATLEVTKTGSAGAVTVDGNASETIGPSASLATTYTAIDAQDDTAIFRSNGTAWILGPKTIAP